MARARNIKPGFYKNEDLAECSIWARFIFPGLWMLADREGRLEDRPKRIKGELLPFDSQDVDPLLSELERFGFLVRYQNSEGSFIQITKFSTHQTPHYSEKPSVIKPHVFQESTAHEEIEKPRELQDDSKKEPPLRGGRNPLNPDSLNPESLYPPTPKGADMFDEFWSAYPKKVGKDAAAKAFAKRKPGKDLVTAMLQALALQKKSAQWLRDGGQYIPNPATWLNEGRWQDEAIAVKAISKTEPDWNSKPEWAVKAGFEDLAAANLARCYERNAHEFSNGKRIEVAA